MPHGDSRRKVGDGGRFAESEADAESHCSIRGNRVTGSGDVRHFGGFGRQMQRDAPGSKSDMPSSPRVTRSEAGAMRVSSKSAA